MKRWEQTELNDDFTLNVVNRYECQLSSEGVLEKYSLEGKIIATNSSTTKTLDKLTVFLAVPDHNLTSEVKFDEIRPSRSIEKELMSVKLNAKDNPLPVIVTETISTSEDFKEDYRVVYPQKDNSVFDCLTVKNQGTVIVTKIRLTKNVEPLSNFQQDQIKIESGSIAIEKNTLIWDIESLGPGKTLTLSFVAKIAVGLFEPPFNEWTSLIFEMPPQSEKKSVWKIRRIEIPNSIEIEPRVFKKIKSEGAVSQWDCQVALKNKTDWDLVLKAMIVVQGTSKTPILERTSEKGNPPIEINARQAWQSDIRTIEQETSPALNITIESDFVPKIIEQILCDLAIPESPFELGKITASRTIVSVELTSPNRIQVVFQSVLKNAGTAPLNDVEIIHQFLRSVELPNPSEVSLAVRGVQVSKKHFEVSQAPSEEIPDCNLFRILIRDIPRALGGVKAGEEIHVTFPVHLNIDFEGGIFKYPTFFNALVRPNTPLLEDIATDKSIANLQVKQKKDVIAIKPVVAEKTYETEVISKFSNLAVDAYNARKYEDALAYCEQILSVAQKIADKAMAQNFTNITAKLRSIIQAKGKK